MFIPALPAQADYIEANKLLTLEDDLEGTKMLAQYIYTLKASAAHVLLGKGPVDVA